MLKKILFFVLSFFTMHFSVGKSIIALNDTAYEKMYSASKDYKESSEQDLTHNNSLVATTLPHSWSAEKPMIEGVYRYFVRFKTNEPNEKLSIYIPRLGNRYKIYLNSTLLHSTGKISDSHYDFAHDPYLQEIPPQIILKNNELKIIVAGEKNRFAGLSTIYIGDTNFLSNKYLTQRFFQIISTWGLIVFCLAISLISFIVSYFGKNKLLLIFGIGSGTWALRITFLLVDFTPFDYRYLLFIFDFLYGIAVSCILLCILSIIKSRSVWLIKLLYFFMFLSVLLPIFYALETPYVRTIFLNCMLLMVSCVFLQYIYQIIKQRSQISYTLLIAFITAVAFGTYDFFIIYQSKQGYELFSLSKFSFFIITVAVSVVFGAKLKYLNHLILINRSRLNARLQLARKNLNTLHAKQIKLTKKETLEQERWRMMQDMHDGLGGKLMSLKYAIQNDIELQKNKITVAFLDQTLEKTIKELRMVVNSSYQEHHNVAYMLGALREKLDDLCTLTHKQLDWDVQALAVYENIDNLKINHLEKMILEIFTNISKYSEATKVKLSAYFSEASAQQPSVVIDITENGSGFKVLKTMAPNLESNQTDFAIHSRKRGLQGLLDRARLIDARIDFMQNATHIKITLPIH